MKKKPAKEQTQVFQANVLLAELPGKWKEIIDKFETSFDESIRSYTFEVDSDAVREELFKVTSPREEVDGFMKSKNLTGEPDFAERKRRVINALIDMRVPLHIKTVKESDDLGKKIGIENPKIIDIPGVFPLYQMLKLLDDGKAESLLKELWVEADDKGDKFRIAISPEELGKLKELTVNRGRKP